MSRPGQPKPVPPPTRVQKAKAWVKQVAWPYLRLQLRHDLKRFLVALKTGLTLCIQKTVGFFKTATAHIKAAVRATVAVLKAFHQRPLAGGEVKMLYGLFFVLGAEFACWIWQQLSGDLVPNQADYIQWLLIHVLPWPVLVLFALFGRQLWITVLGAYAFATMLLALHSLSAFQVAMPWDPAPVYLMLLQAISAFGVTYYTLLWRWQKRQEAWLLLHPPVVPASIKERMLAAKTFVLTQYQQRKVQMQVAIQTRRKQWQELRKTKLKAFQKWKLQLPGKFQKYRAAKLKQAQKIQAQTPKLFSKWLANGRNKAKLWIKAKLTVIKAKINLFKGFVKALPKKMGAAKKQALNFIKTKFRAAQGQFKASQSRIKTYPKLTRSWLLAKQKLVLSKIRAVPKWFAAKLKQAMALIKTANKTVSSKRVKVKKQVINIPRRVAALIKLTRQKAKAFWPKLLKNIKILPSTCKQRFAEKWARWSVPLKPYQAKAYAIYKEIFPFEVSLPQWGALFAKKPPASKTQAKPKPVPQPIAVP